LQSRVPLAEGPGILGHRPGGWPPLLILGKDRYPDPESTHARDDLVEGVRGLRRCGRSIQQLDDLLHESDDHPTFDLVELRGIPQVGALAAATETAGHQWSFWKVAQRPNPWRASVSISIFSRGPVDTTARPLVCTSIISFSAFSRL